MPIRPWVWRQTWNDLLLLHWPVPSAAIRPLIPPALNLHRFDGTAWVGLSAFWIHGQQIRSLPWLRRTEYPALSVHTFVIRNGKPGLWFLTLGGGSRMDVWLGRHLLRLPFTPLGITVDRSVARVHHRAVRPDGAVFEAHYSPIGEVVSPVPGTLAHWLTERYAIYSVGSGNRLFCSEVHHMRWPIQPVSASVKRNDLLPPGAQGSPASVFYTPRVELVGWDPTVRPAVTDLEGARFGAPVTAAKRFEQESPPPAPALPAGLPGPAASAASSPML
jgi:uncharacterized protein YqjF (DUF2071 family)